jgi:hypothetical protein
MNNLEKSYTLLFTELEKIDIEDDNEKSHILQDKIYRKFIRDICKNKFTTIKDIRKIAIDMNNNVVRRDKERWYV